MNLQLTLALLNKPWLIDSNFLGSNSHLLINALKGVTDDTKITSSTVATYSNQTFSAATSQSDEDPFAHAPKGSIATINVRGMMMKNNQFCGPAGTSTIGQWIKAADQSKNIAGMLMIFDTPGGSVDGLEVFSNTIKSFSKPSATYVDNMMASAGVWAGSSTNRTFISGKTAMVGSIGTMMTIMDASKQLNKQGISLKEVYADGSEDKNKAWADILDGNNDTMKVERLNPLNEAFHAAVKTNRPHIKQEAMTGKIYLGQTAIDMGIADEIGTLEDALAYISSQINNSENNFSMKNKYPALTAALGQDFEMTDEGVHFQPEALDALELAMNSGAIQTTITGLEAARKTISSLTEERDEAKSALTSMTTARDDWQAKAEAFGAQPSSDGATPTAPKEEVKEENKHGYARQEDGLEALANGK